MYNKSDPTFQALDQLHYIQDNIGKNFMLWTTEARALEAFFGFYKEHSGYQDFEIDRIDGVVKAIIKCGSNVGELHYQLTPLGRIVIFYKVIIGSRERHQILDYVEISDLKDSKNEAIKKQFTIFLQQFIAAMEDLDGKPIGQ